MTIDAKPPAPSSGNATQGPSKAAPEPADAKRRQPAMQGTLLRLYVHENRRHRKLLLYEWVLEEAKKMGIHGGSAFRAIAGFGRHGVLHEEHFFELAGELTVEIDFAVSDREADQLIGALDRERLQVFYTRSAIRYGVTGDPAAASRESAT